MNGPCTHRRFVVLGLLALLAGCASKHEVKCDGHLEPINRVPPVRVLDVPVGMPNV